MPDTGFEVTRLHNGVPQRYRLMVKSFTLSDGITKIPIYYFVHATDKTYKQPELLDTPLRYGSTVESQVAVARAMVEHTGVTQEDAAVAVGRLAARLEGLSPRELSQRYHDILNALAENN